MENQVHPAAGSSTSHHTGLGRRRLLGVGLGGTAVALVPVLVGRTAQAAAPPDGTTTEPPKRPTSDDTELLGFVQGVEMAAASLYDMTLGITSFDETEHTMLAILAQSHRSYGQSLAGLLGRSAPNKVDQSVLTTFSEAFGSGNIDQILDAASTLESTLVATNIQAIGELSGTDAANLMASIVTIEGRHGTVIADMLGAKKLADLLVDEEAAPLMAGKG